MSIIRALFDFFKNIKNQNIIFVIFIIFISLSLIYGIESKNLSFKFYLIMLFLSLFTIIWRYFHDKDILENINILIKINNKYDNKNNISLEDFNNLRDKLKNKINNKILKNSLDGFLNSFHINTQTMDAEYFFNNDLLLKERINLKLLNYLPQALVGLGLLGTFLGLTTGLNGIDLSNKETISSSINILIDGTKVSFSTSLYGMYFSIIISFFINIYISFYEKKIIELKNKFNLIFHKNNEEGKFNEIKEEIKAIVISNKDMAENIANQLKVFDKNITNVFSNLEESNKKLNEKIVDQLENTMGDGFKEVLSNNLNKIFSSNFVEKFQEIKNELIEVSMKNNNFIENYSKNIEEINSNSKSIKDDYVILTEVFNNLKDKISSKYLDMNKAYSDFMELTSNINAIQKENREYLSEFQNFSEKSFKITNSLDKFIDAEKEVVNVWKQYENSFSGMNNKLESNLLSYKNILDKTSKDYINIITDGVDDYTEKLKNGVHSLFKDYDTNISKVIEQFYKAIEHLSEKVMESSDVLSTQSDILINNKKQIEKLNIILNKKNIE